MRLARVTLVPALLALALAAPSHAQATTPRDTAASTAAGGAYSSDSTAFVVGKQVHLRSTKTFIGVIRAVDDNHSFPPSRFARAKMKAVLIERRDGSLDWVPVERITRIYVVSK
jgi:hypothetical protein